MGFFSKKLCVQWKRGKLYGAWVYIRPNLCYDQRARREGLRDPGSALRANVQEVLNMDQIRTGKFIAERRRSEGLTQAELAEALGISDKTVSKWECGKGLPEVSLMLPLCERLHISVNDLLSGARVTEEDYRRRAEENLLSLVQENHENRKNFGLSLVCGIVTVIAVCALTALASFLELPAPVRVALLILAVATAAAGIGARRPGRIL